MHSVKNSTALYSWVQRISFWVWQAAFCTKQLATLQKLFSFEKDFQQRFTFENRIHSATRPFKPLWRNLYRTDVVTKCFSPPKINNFQSRGLLINFVQEMVLTNRILWPLEEKIYCNPSIDHPKRLGLQNDIILPKKTGLYEGRRSEDIKTVNI